MFREGIFAGQAREKESKSKEKTVLVCGIKIKEGQRNLTESNELDPPPKYGYVKI